MQNKIIFLRNLKYAYENKNFIGMENKKFQSLIYSDGYIIILNKTNKKAFFRSKTLIDIDKLDKIIKDYITQKEYEIALTYKDVYLTIPENEKLKKFIIDMFKQNNYKLIFCEKDNSLYINKYMLKFGVDLSPLKEIEEKDNEKIKCNKSKNIEIKKEEELKIDKKEFDYLNNQETKIKIDKRNIDEYLTKLNEILEKTENNPDKYIDILWKGLCTIFNEKKTISYSSNTRKGEVPLMRFLLVYITINNNVCNKTYILLKIKKSRHLYSYAEKIIEGEILTNNIIVKKIIKYLCNNCFLNIKL